MKFKPSEKFVILETAIYSDEKVFKKGEIYPLGEICPFGVLIEEYSPDYLIEFADDKIEEIFKKIKPLALVRQERIDEILS